MKNSEVQYVHFFGEPVNLVAAARVISVLATFTDVYVSLQCRHVLHRLMADVTQQILL